jgi:carbamoyl-phosphate synthase large subunit
MSIPTITLPEDVKGKIRKCMRDIARKLSIKGPFNIQFLVKQGNVYVIECNLRASRSMPFVSKTVGVNLMEISADAILGKEIIDGEKVPKLYGVKSPQFSFMRLEGVDPVTNVEMVSTGEVACFGKTFEEAFIKSLIASGFILPNVGDKILISGNDVTVVSLARKLANKGFGILVLNDTAKLFESANMQVSIINSMNGNDKNWIDYLTNRRIGLVIDVPQPNSIMNENDLHYLVRRKAVEFSVPIITNLELAKTFVTIIENLDEVESYEFKK